MSNGHSAGTQKDTIFVGLGARGSVSITPASADAAFMEALSVLPASGGVLYVMPGTQPFVFQNPVVVSKPDVRIEFQGGPNVGAATPTSYLAFPTSGGPKQLFRIEAPRFHVQGAAVVHSAGNVAGSDNDRSCFLVQAVDDARFSECSFVFTQDSGSITGFTAIRARGASSSAPNAGLRVDDCTFRIRSGTPLDSPSGTGAPKGIVCIRAEDFDQVLVSDCVVRGAPSLSRDTYCGSVIYLDHCAGSVISDTSIRFIDLHSSLASKAADAVIRMTTQGSGEGHRSIAARCLFEDIGARSVIQMNDARSDVVAYSNFGRILPYSESVLEVVGPESRCVVVHGVNFHNVSAKQLVPEPVPNHMIDLQQARVVTVAGTVFKPFDSKQAFMRTTPGACANLAVGPSNSQLAE